jgi:hypothetical protein
MPSPLVDRPEKEQDHEKRNKIGTKEKKGERKKLNEEAVSRGSSPL